jgi:hypothetical protein
MYEETVKKKKVKKSNPKRMKKRNQKRYPEP